MVDVVALVDEVVEDVVLEVAALVVVEAVSVTVFSIFALLRAFSTALMIPLLLYVAPETASTSEDWLLMMEFLTVANALL